MRNKIKLFKKKIIFSYFFSILIVLVFTIIPISTAFSQYENIDNKNAQIDSSATGVISKVAPGELLPISIKLSNFGGGKRVDVNISYLIFTNTGEEIYRSHEVVAVETTANFTKIVQIPHNARPGFYNVKTSVTYAGQIFPADTQFPFTVEKKILGLFQSDFFLYGVITLIISIFVFALSIAFAKRRRSTRFTPFDYSNIPHDKRTFFEILSDTIMEMRERVGDEALNIASNIDGLKIDKANGRVLAINSPPEKIIATLVYEYEQLLGEKVSFLFRKK